MEKQRSWTCTFVVQVFLCGVLYLSLNLGQPQNSSLEKGSGSFRNLDDVFFISVRGGFRQHQQQIHLLKQMENVAGLYNVTFVVNISEFGEDDPLVRNASKNFLSLNVPWNTASKGVKVESFTKKIELSHGKTLNILEVNAETLQDLVLVGSTSGSGNLQSNRIIQMLEAAAGNWVIVAGYDPVVDCAENSQQMESKLAQEPIHRIFARFGANAYLSRGSCSYASQDGVTYIGLPDPANAELNMASFNAKQVSEREMGDGFLLHRINSQQMTTYFVSSAGESGRRHQMGREIL